MPDLIELERTIDKALNDFVASHPVYPSSVEKMYHDRAYHSLRELLAKVRIEIAERERATEAEYAAVQARRNLPVYEGGGCV